MGRILGKMEIIISTQETIQKDSKHIKNNDKNELERIATLENHNKLMERWRTGILQLIKKQIINYTD